MTECPYYHPLGSFAPPRSTYQQVYDAMPRTCAAEEECTAPAYPTFVGNGFACTAGHKWEWRYQEAP